MQILKTHYHPEIYSLENKSIFTRLATRSITLQGASILLMYTERYEDYSLPGGGLDLGEDKTAGMIRELREETGAQNIKNIKPLPIVLNTLNTKRHSFCLPTGSVTHKNFRVLNAQLRTPRLNKI